MTPPVLTTRRLTLRGHELGDYAPLTEMWARAEVTKHISADPDTPETAWAKLMFHIGHWTALGFGYWAITERETGRYMGMAGFCVLPRQCTPPLGDCIEAGWALAPAFQGGGFASEAMQAAMIWADAQQVWRETTAMIAMGNERSHDLAGRLGFISSHQVQYCEGTSLIYRRQSGASMAFPPAC